MLILCKKTAYLYIWPTKSFQWPARFGDSCPHWFPESGNAGTVPATRKLLPWKSSLQRSWVGDGASTITCRRLERGKKGRRAMQSATKVKPSSNGAQTRRWNDNVLNDVVVSLAYLRPIRVSRLRSPPPPPAHATIDRRSRRRCFLTVLNTQFPWYSRQLSARPRYRTLPLLITAPRYSYQHVYRIHNDRQTTAWQLVCTERLE